MEKIRGKKKENKKNATDVLGLKDFS